MPNNSNVKYWYQGKPLVRYCVENRISYSSVFKWIQLNYTIENAIKKAKERSEDAMKYNQRVYKGRTLVDYLEQNYKYPIKAYIRFQKNYYKCNKNIAKTLKTLEDLK